MAQATADDSEKKFYDLRAKETEVRLVDELAGVYRDYCLEVWTKALNLTGVPTTSKWRRAENVYYPLDLRKALEDPSAPKVNAAPITTAPK